MRVGIFKSVKAAKLQETELDRIVYMMQFSQEICTRTQIYRQYLEWHDMKKGKKNITRKLKEMKITRFPAFTPCAIFYDGKSSVTPGTGTANTNDGGGQKSDGRGKMEEG